MDKKGLELKSVFLADDDPDDVSLFKDTLEHIDPAIQLISAINGLEALTKLRSEHAIFPDIIFLDLNMPQVDGIQCLTVLKNDEALKDIPVIMLSTSSQAKDVMRTLILGAACFITKPNSIKELKKILSSVVYTSPQSLPEMLARLKSETQTSIFVS